MMSYHIEKVLLKLHAVIATMGIDCAVIIATCSNNRFSAENHVRN